MLRRKSFSTDCLFVLLLYSVSSIILAIPRDDVNDPFGSEWKQFNYGEQDTWGSNSSETRLEACQNGTLQSPVNIQPHNVREEKNLIVFANYTNRIQAKVSYIGDKLIINDIFAEPRPNVKVENRGIYKLHAIIIHFSNTKGSDGSEHHIDGEHADMEIQFMHKLVILDEKKREKLSRNGWLGLAVRYKQIKSHDEEAQNHDFGSCLQKFHSARKSDKSDKSDIDSPSVRCDLALLKFLTNGGYYYGYSGSLTVPPCTEQVFWLVAEETRNLDDEYFKLLRDLMPVTNTTEPLTKRKIKRDEGKITKMRSIVEGGVVEQRTRVLRLGRTLVFGAKYYLIIVILVLLAIYVMNA